MGTGEWAAVVAFGLLGALPGLCRLILAFPTLWHGHVRHRDLAAAVIEDSDGGSQFGNAIIKLAYAGNSRLIVERLEYRARLDLESRLEWVKTCLRVAIGYVKNDKDGLAAVLGPDPYRGLPGTHNDLLLRVWSAVMASRYIYSLLLVLHPLTWMGYLLGLGLPADFHINLEGENQDVGFEPAPPSDSDLTRPFVLDPGTDRRFNFSYTFRVSSRCFASDSIVSAVEAGPKLRAWELPRPGEMTWIAKEELRLKIRNRWRSFRVSLGERRVTVMPWVQ